MHHIAFLRGINVGGRRVKMDRLKEVFASLVFSNVHTFLASGNVLFDADESEGGSAEPRIEACLESALGFRVEAFVRKASELAAVAAFRPFDEAGEVAGNTLHVGFLRERPGPAIESKLKSLRTARDDLRLEGREFYWLCRGKVTDSLVSWNVVARAVGGPCTLRNMSMLRRLAALVTGPS